MTHRVYVGPHPEVELAALGVLVARGEQVEIVDNDELVAALDKQPSNWAKPNTKAAKLVGEQGPEVVNPEETPVSALNAQLGVAEETTWGTIATPTRFPEFVDESITATYARVESKGLRAGRLFMSEDRFTTYAEGAAGDINLEVGSVGFGLFLKHMLGSIATTGPVTSVYTHTATPSETGLAGKGLTVQVGRPFYEGGVAQPFTYAGGKVATWELSNDNSGNLMCKLGMDFATEATATALATASYGTQETFSWVGGSVTVGGSAFDVTNASVSGENGLNTDRRYLRNNTAKKEQVGNDYRTGAFSLEADFDSLTHRNRVASVTAAGAVATTVLTWQGKTIIGSGSLYPQLQVTIRSRFDKWAAPVKGPDAITQKIDGVYLGTSAISIAYQTLDVTPVTNPDASALRDLQDDLEVMGQEFVDAMVRKIEQSAGTAVQAAKRAAATFSRRIPSAIGASVNTEGTFAGVTIRVDGSRAPHAIPLDNNGRSGTFRVPLFGNRNHWFPHQAHPFFGTSIFPVLEQTAEQVEQAIDAVSARYGFL